MHVSLPCRTSIYCQSPAIAVGADVVYAILGSVRAALVVAVVRTAVIRCERQAKTHDDSSQRPRGEPFPATEGCMPTEPQQVLPGASQSRVRATMVTPCRNVSPSFHCGPRENTCQSSSGHRGRRCWPCVTQKQPDRDKQKNVRTDEYRHHFFTPNSMWVNDARASVPHAYDAMATVPTTTTTTTCISITLYVHTCTQGHIP